MIGGFSRLRADLGECRDFGKFSADALLEPFLEIISSQTTTGSITLMALSAVSKFFSLGIINDESKDLQPALHQLSIAITHCRFEATYQAEDDAVLLKILSLMEEIVCTEHGRLLSDDSICEIVETCLSMACQMRRGDVLRRAAEMTMVKLTQTVFWRLRGIEPEIDEDPIEDGEVKLNNETGDENDGDTKTEAEETAAGDTSTVEDVGSRITVQNPTEDTDGPYGMNTIREVFRVLISILDPGNMHQYTDSTRIMALKLINVAFEVSGTHIAEHPSLLQLTMTTLCKYLFQMIRYDNVQLVQSALRVISTLLHTCRSHLKMQQEFFFTYLLTCLSPISDLPREPDVDNIFYDGVPNVPRLINPRTATSTPIENKNGSSTGSTPVPTPTAFLTFKSPEVREVMVEAITSLARIPSFFNDLFVNYDCDVDRADLCEDLIGFLCRNAYPDSASWSTPSVPPLCLEAVLAFLNYLDRGLEVSSSPEQDENVEKVLDAKNRKKMLISVADTFNDNPKAGVAMLVAKGIVKDDSPESIARFLKESGRINKTVLGEYLAKPANKEVKNKFIDQFDFSGKRLDEALREFLSAFRLPGESQQIEQIFEKFANQYCKGEGNTEEIENEDAAFVLSYAIIMLNTDLHSSQIKKRMTVDQFKNNLRDANNGKNFSGQFLEDIYKTIRSREIIMPDEHDNDETFEYAWKEMLLKTSQAGKLEVYTKNGFDKHVFEASWRPIITTLSFVFATATDDTVFSRVITGFDQAARVASAYKIPKVLDHITKCLSKMSSLTAGDLSMPTNNVEIHIEDGSVTVSDLSVPFGSDFKAQMATVIFFRIAKTHTAMINEGWNQILRVLANLYLYNLLPDLENKFGISLPRIKPQHTIKRNKGGREIGLFSTLSSYLTGSGDSTPEPTDEEVDATLSTVDCVKSCGVEEMFESMRSLEGKSLDRLTEFLINNIPNIIDATPSFKQSFYSVTLFYLEVLVMLGANVQGALYNYLQNWEDLDSEFIIRVINYSLRIGAVNHLPAIVNVNSKILRSAALNIVKSVTELPLNEQVLHSGDYWKLLDIVSSNEEATQPIFEHVSKLKAHVDKENFNYLLAVMGQIANVGASGAQVEQNQLDRVKGKTERKELEEKIQGDVNRALESIEIIYSLGDQIDQFKDTEWSELWYPFIQCLSGQCINPSRKVRSRAFGYFQKILLSPEVHAKDGFDFPRTFDRAIFPLIGTLLKPEVYETDVEGMAATRLHVASLLCKVFLQYVINIQYNQEVLNLWTRILETLDRLINSGQRDTLKESVVESLKNVLLVVSSSEFGADDQFWTETWKRIDGFLPGLKDQVFPKNDDDDDDTQPSQNEHESNDK